MTIDGNKLMMSLNDWWYSSFGYDEETEDSKAIKTVIDKIEESLKDFIPESCEDTISRADAIRVASGYCHPSNIAKELAKLPPVTPKPKTEKCKWIRYDYRTICPKNHDIDNPYWRIPENTECLKYCPYCGREIEVV